MDDGNDKRPIIKYSGISFSGMLTILFIALKLTGVIDWGWLWVLSPLWIGAAIVLGIFVVFFVVAIVLAIICELLK